MRLRSFNSPDKSSYALPFHFKFSLSIYTPLYIPEKPSRTSPLVSRNLVAAQIASLNLVLHLSYSRSRSRPRTRVLALALVFSLSLLDFALPRSRFPTLSRALPRSITLSCSHAHIPHVIHFAHRNRYCAFARIVNKPILSQLSHSRKGYSPTRTLSSRLYLVVF